MSVIKTQIQKTAQDAIDVLNAGIQSESSPDWLVLDFENAQAAYQQLEDSIELLKTLPEQHQEFVDRARNMLTYTEATVSVLNDNTAEAHRGRSSSAVQQMTRLLRLLDLKFPGEGSAQQAPSLN